mmetsp:Transcript_39191/g.54656  ORF Transcript_39191/g.54656 Transcript_39191/m.54656 type:complete len:319 (+) Transcript_39191:24-980(+)
MRILFALFFFLNCSLFVTPCSIPGIFDGAWNQTVSALRELSKKCTEFVAVTVITNRYDTLKPAPPGWSDHVCSIAIVDAETYEWIFGKKTVTDPVLLKQKSSGWKVVKEERMPFVNNQCNVRTVKSLLLKFLPYTTHALYLDGTYTMKRPLKFFKDKYVKNNTNLFFISHPNRHDAKEEMKTVMKLHLTPENIVKRQDEDYTAEFQKDYHSPYLHQGNFHYRRNIPEVHAFECLWFSDIMDYSHRDQLSLPKAILDSGLTSTTKAISPKEGKEFLAQGGHSHAVNRQLNSKVIYPCGISPRRDFSAEKSAGTTTSSKK